MKLVARQTIAADEYSNRHTAAVAGSVKAHVRVVRFCNRRSLSSERPIKENVRNYDDVTSLGPTGCAENTKVR
jgi:hypothetical protein